MRLKQAQALAQAIQSHLSSKGHEVPLSLVRDAVAAATGSDNWKTFKTNALTPTPVTALDLKPTPPLDVLSCLGQENADTWGRAITSARAFGKLFVIVAEDAKLAELAVAVSQMVLAQKGRRVRRLDFSALANKAAVDEQFSELIEDGADTAILSGLTDGEDYDALWTLLKANWQVVVRVDSSIALEQLFARTRLDADSKNIGMMLGLVSQGDKVAPLSYIYQRAAEH